MWVNNKIIKSILPVYYSQNMYIPLNTPSYKNTNCYPKDSSLSRCHLFSWNPTEILNLASVSNLIDVWLFLDWCPVKIQGCLFLIKTSLWGSWTIFWEIANSAFLEKSSNSSILLPTIMKSNTRGILLKKGVPFQNWSSYKFSKMTH